MSYKFIIFVIDDSSASGTPQEMIAIDSFNQKLKENGHWIFAGGLAEPSQSNVIDNRLGLGVETGKPLFPNSEQFTGFWLIQSDTYEIAKQLAFDGSKACHRKIELRPLFG